MVGSGYVVTTIRQVTNTLYEWFVTEEPLGTQQNLVSMRYLCFQAHEDERIEMRMWRLGRAMQSHSVRSLAGLTMPYKGKCLTHSLAERTALCLSPYTRHFSGHS